MHLFRVVFKSKFHDNLDDSGLPMNGQYQHISRRLDIASIVNLLLELPDLFIESKSKKVCAISQTDVHDCVTSHVSLDPKSKVFEATIYYDATCYDLPEVQGAVINRLHQVQATS
jgi:hypothetical protein